MEIFVVLFIVVVLATATIVFAMNKNKQKNTLLDNGKETTVVSMEVENLPIKFEMLPVESTVDESKLVEITDEKVLARIIDVVPEMARVGVSIGDVAKNNGQVLYQAVIPAGAKLVGSKEMPGAVRGLYRGTSGIKGHANLVEVNNTANVIQNVTSATMNVASMVVGQYYMSQINSQLEDITKKISCVTNFQDNEFMSKVFALVSQIKIISEFQVEIIDNSELRSSELSKLSNLEHECIELLGQANKTISDYTTNKTETYEDYQSAFVEIQKWTVYQRSLLEVLYKVSELRFALYLGKVSIQYCISLLDTYSEQTEKVCSLLSMWHQQQLKNYDVHLAASNRKRDGLDGIVHKIPALFNKEHSYKPISKDVVVTIENQMQEFKKPKASIQSALTENDVKIIAKNGKLYYLPECE